jgi:hypothetical protein
MIALIYAGNCFGVPLCNIGQSGVLVWILASIGIVHGLTFMTLTIATRRLLTEWRPLLLSHLLFFTAVSIYFYNAIASMTTPPVNWGYPRTVEGFFHLLSRGQFEKCHPTDNLARYATQIPIYWHALSLHIGYFFLLPIVVLAFFLRRMESPGRRWILGLFLLYLSLSFLFLVLLNPSPDRQTAGLIMPFFIAAHLIVALFVGYGLVFVQCLLSRSNLRK